MSDSPQSPAKYNMIYGGMSIIRKIVGPPSPSWIFGHMLQLTLPRRFGAGFGEFEFKWLKLYGPVYRIKACFGQDRLMIADPVALQYIFNSPDFEKGPTRDMLLHLMNGDLSLSCVKGKIIPPSNTWQNVLNHLYNIGDTHKRFRAAMNNKFNAPIVRRYQSVFESLAHEATLRPIGDHVDTNGRCLATAGGCNIERNMSKYDMLIFGISLKDLGEELISSNSQILSPLAASLSAASILVDAIRVRLPSWVSVIASLLPTPAFTVIRKNRYLASQLGSRIVHEKMNAARKGLDIDNDIYGLLVATGHLEARKSAGMSPDEIAGQAPLLLIAGQDTTANAVSFALLELARNPETQDQLRAEIQVMLSERSTNVAYDNMPLLNAFIKEVLRVFSAGPIKERMAVRDAIIPLKERIITASGEQITAIPVSKGEVVIVAPASYHRLASRWGSDAHEFKPSRWLDGTASQTDAIGPYANLLTFLAGGRTCLGWRFAILEMQVLLFELVRKFSFALTPDSGSVVQPRVTGVLMPTLSNGKRSLPLCVKKIE
ncbi:Cytochrome P450 [Mycena venus]|uniref:Cytochrome P450 n=1 Tax=Mycena venus TaxID=2733690 RepID=A0A8H6YBC0_9AGAR|nr:Cytochrome P450 [Mycena venus]